ESDKQAGKITIAVKLGLKKAKRYHFFLVGGAMVISMVFFLFYYTNPFNALFFLAFIPLMLHLSIIAKTDKASAFDKQLKVLALSTFLFSLLIGVGYIL
ncbi:MAG: 1,4-dihydroxy-2-naphthoate polyprenyltransferase, partial [Bacteroidota bacterium]